MKDPLNWEEQISICKQAYARGDYDVCENYFCKAIETLKKLNKADIRLGYANMMLGLCHQGRKDYTSAIPYFKVATRIYEKHNDKNVIENFRLLGNCLSFLRLPKKAGQAYLNAITKYKTLKYDDKQLLAQLYTFVAMEFWFSGKPTQSKIFFKKAINLASPESLPLPVLGILSKMLTGIALDNIDKGKVVSGWKELANSARQLLKTKKAQALVPKSRDTDHFDTYFSTHIFDPYRWLEQTSSDEVTEWINQQNSYSDGFLESIPGGWQLLERVASFRSPTRTYLPFKRGAYYYYHFIPQGKSRSQLFRVKKLGQYPKLLLDANKFPNEDDIEEIWLSPNVEFAAYSLPKNNSHCFTLVVQNLQTNKSHKEFLLDMHELDVTWKPDSSGFYYTTSSMSQSKPTQMVHFHKLGTTQDKDELIYSAKNLSTNISIYISDDNKYLVITCDDKYNLRYSALLHSLSSSKKFDIISEMHYPFWYVGNRDTNFYFITFQDAPLGRLVSLDITNRNKKKLLLKEVVSEQQYLLRDVYLWQNCIGLYFVTDTESILRRTDYNGKIVGEISLPANTQKVSSAEANETDRFIEIEGYLYPKKILLYKSQNDEILPISNNNTTFDLSKYTSKKYFLRTADGFRLCVTLNYKKGLKKNGDTPTILTAYGGFGVYARPIYSARNIAWMENGGIFAEAIIRGDGDFGWEFEAHGKRKNKPNTIKDLIQIAEYLVKEGYTRPEKLGLIGTSHGGLIAASALLKSPHLFGAVVIVSAPLDVLRHTSFGCSQTKIGEYGTKNDIDDFRVLNSYSPLHNVKSAIYPAVLILAGENDDNVLPFHSYKFLAALQNAQRGTAPILLRTYKTGGHLDNHAKAFDDRLTFLYDQLMNL